MSTSAQFTFAAEFVAFLAAAAGLAMALLRGEVVVRPTWVRAPLGFGFAALAGAAFLRGSLIVDGATAEVVVLRVAGLAALAAASLRWEERGLGRYLLWGAIAATGAATYGQARDNAGGDAALVVGSAFVLGAVLIASRRSLAARVAASAAGVLLIMVLVLSLALSAVLSDTVEHEASVRLDVRARTEVGLLERESNIALRGSLLVGQSLATSRGALLHQLATSPARSGQLDQDLFNLSRNFLSDLPIAYFSPTGVVLAATGFDPAALVPIAGSAAVAEANSRRIEVETVAVVNVDAIALGVEPVLADDPDGGRSHLGTVVVASLLNDGYLNQRTSDDQRLRLALVTRTQRLSSTPEFATGARARSLAQAVLQSGLPKSASFDGLFFSARPVNDSAGNTVMVLVATTPTTIVDNTRESLFRTLFIIALGGTLLSLLLAAFVGERIGARVRRLTVAATAIQEGDLSVRAGLDASDEVGVLGSTFDAMASSLEEQTAALRQAADDEAQLRSRLEAIVAGMGEALVAVDARGRVTDFNQAAEELIGVNSGTARGRPVTDVLRLVTDDGVDLAPRLRQPIARRWSAAATLTPRIGKNVPVVVSGGALRGRSAELVGGVFVLRDLTREREVDRMKTEFLSHVGHELRTPLAGVIGFSQLLTRRNMTPEQSKSLQTEILDSAKRLERIVEMLEFFASTAAGRVMLRPEELDPREIVDDVVSRWTVTAAPKHDLVRKVARGVRKIRADRKWMTRVLDELVDNAVKFSPDGGKVTVSVANDPENNRVVFTVADNGIGMSDEERSNAFVDFAQGDGSDTRSFGGLGLGLALVKRVTEGHGGTVTVQPQEKGGSLFSVSVPVAPIRRK
ncbi:MAG: two-component system, OmpR family, sensor histidine kinase VicK [Actinomycetota bacterium]|jgi:two-component system phosphate regulon sensor histidine kinase PhoR